MMPRIAPVLKRMILIWLVMCALGVIVGESTAQAHGLKLTLTGAANYTRQQTSRWPYFDGVDLATDDIRNTVRHIHLEGFVWQGQSGQTTWHAVHNGKLSIRVNGQSVYQADGDSVVVMRDFPVVWEGEAAHVAIDYFFPARPESGQRRLEIGIYERTPWGGWQLLAEPRLYISPPHPESASSEIVRGTLTGLSWSGLLIGLLVLLVGRVWSERLWARREAWAIAGVFVVALLVRSVILLERSERDLFFFSNRTGADNYVFASRAWLNGQLSLLNSFRPPGAYVWLGGLIHLLGPHLWALYWVMVILSALSVAALAAAGRIAFRSRAGLMGGLIAALYPPLIFFHTTLGNDTITAILTAVLMVLGAWLGDRPNWKRAAVFGTGMGLAALVRPTGLLFGPALFVALIIVRERAGAWHGWQKIVSLTAAAALGCVLTISPLAVANRLSGSNTIISNNGPVDLYIANNRDTGGNSGFSQAFFVAKQRGDSWATAVFNDLRADPLRAVTLLLHKIGLFWQNVSQGNVYDYIAQGVHASIFLRMLSLDGRVGMTALGWLAVSGLALLLSHSAQRQRLFPWLLALSIVFSMLGTALFEVSERHRLNSIPLLCMAAGATVAHLFEVARTRRLDRSLLLAGATALLALVIASGFDLYLPPKRFLHDDLPAETIVRDDNFGGHIKLIGLAPLETDHQPGGYLYVTLYWQTVTRTDVDYNVSVQLVDPTGKRVAGKDTLLGSVSYPTLGTSAWPADGRLAESYLVDLPNDAPAVMDVYVLLYDSATMVRLPLLAPDGSPIEANWVRIGRVGNVAAGSMPALLDSLEDVNYTLGEWLHITGWQVTRQASAPGELTVSVRWEASAPIPEDYVIFFHLLNGAGDLVAQSDSPTLTGDWTTAALIPGYPLDSISLLSLPGDLPPGDYQLWMGAYHYPSLERLPAWDGTGNPLPSGLIALGAIRIR